MGQQIYGSSQKVAQFVSLDCAPELVGDSLSVHLSQSPASGAVWTIEVFVHIAQGTYSLGVVTTVAPLVSGLSPARTILIATCPGARGWSLQATCDTNDEEAEIALQSSKCCTSAIGVRSVEDANGPVTDVNIVSPIPLPVSIEDVVDINDTSPPWTETFSTALDDFFIGFSGTGVLRSLTVRVDATLATGTYYLQLWNLDVIPSNGTAVTDSNSLAAPWKIQHVLGQDDVIRYDFNEHGIEFDPGFSLKLSTTEFTKTGVETNNLSVISAEYRETF